MIHKLNLDEFEKIDYHLIAIHTLIEDYRLAYFINSQLSINLNLDDKGIEISDNKKKTTFSKFMYYDNETRVTWNLIQNKNVVLEEKKEDSQSLFSNHVFEISTNFFLLPELKKVDFFLKIENSEDLINITEVIYQLNNIENISTSYIIETNKLKKKNNLIF